MALPGIEPGTDANNPRRVTTTPCARKYLIYMFWKHVCRSYLSGLVVVHMIGLEDT